ncbi:MAG: NADH-quinone oxidoreductase subunit NuoF [Candidatus Thorarchaeota archaeon]
MSSKKGSEQGTLEIRACRGTGCESARAFELLEVLEKEVADKGLKNKVRVKTIGCHGFCEQGPVITVEPEGLFYCQVDKKDINEIVESHLIGGKPVERLFYVEPATGKKIPKYEDIPFYKGQMKVVLRNCGEIDPGSIDEYIEMGGYDGLKKALLEMKPEQVIDQILKSGLRGRGGAGFPTGLKWKFGRGSRSDKKYVVCNADEGDPGAFMDGAILVADPHAVLEGLTVAAYSIGADEGFVYVRHEYPQAVDSIKKAIIDSRKRGLLGKNILGSGFSFDLSVKEGAGAFVCGEETALMASIEGERGTPRPRPPFPTDSGLWGKPTCINNVKTLATIPIILRRGAEWFSSIGTDKSKGTAIFSLTGKVKNTGLVEVPMGTTLRHIIFDVGGGIQDDGKFKAVQTGGPSGGCLPADRLDLPVDYDSLTQAGTIMGSGGMIVMDETTCMVDVARYFLSFTQAESCGKCTPCRMGTLEMLKLLDKIKSGNGEEGDIEKLQELAITVKEGSLCGLGQTAPNPVLTTIRYFRDEYEAHIRDKICPAEVCKDLIKYTIVAEKCIGCGACLRICPANAITGKKNEVHVILDELCIKCGACFEVCPPTAKAVDKIPAHHGGGH